MRIISLTVGFVATNCYIVYSDKSKRGIVIDPGAGAREILQKINQNQLSIVSIIITHTHPDHLGALHEVKVATNAKIAMGAGADKNISSAMFKTISAMTGGSFKVPKSEIVLNDGDNVEIDDLLFKVIATPGHSLDGISLYGHGVLFSGDTLFNQGIGRTDFSGGDIKILAHSIKQKLYTLPDETVVYPGHGPATTIGDEKRGNPFIR